MICPASVFHMDLHVKSDIDLGINTEGATISDTFNPSFMAFTN
jgi:hypothetical protein